MRSLLFAALALVTLAPACETSPGDDDRLEGLADNLCGEEARCLVESCSDVLGLSPEQDECADECRTYPCPAEDHECAMAYSDIRDRSVTIYYRCNGVMGLEGRPYGDADCEESLSLCDGVQDPT